jgi:hypothetical protein
MLISELLRESGYEEAGELLSQPVPEIRQFVSALGLPSPIDWNNPQQIKLAQRLGAVIDSVPATAIAAAAIPQLKNLANKPGEDRILKQIISISGKPNAAERYATIMNARDSAEGRKRGYDVGSLIQSLQNGRYESPVILQLPTGLYVIGGRTRLYAALALGQQINVKIINANTFARTERTN